MEKITGKDDFNGTFDFFEWSAPYYNDIVWTAVETECDKINNFSTFR